MYNLFSLLFPKKKIVVHDGRFHADEIFACATLYLIHKGNIAVRRTREPEVIETADYVLDVGGVYNHSERRYDHHQREGAGVRENGIPYATFGLIWKHYGQLLVSSENVWNIIDLKLACPIDAGDNGVTVYDTKSAGVFPYTVQDVIGTRVPSWLEERRINLNDEFLNLVVFAADILDREINKAEAIEEAKERIRRDYEHAVDKRVIVLSERYPFEVLLPEYKDALIAVYQGRNGLWRTEGVPEKPSDYFNRRQYFPEEWGGLRDEALEAMTKVRGARFCHRDRYMCVAETKEGALKLAHLAIIHKK